MMKKNEQMKLPPEYLYHYCVFNKFTQNIFNKNELFFSCPSDFNDPFDSQIRPFDNQIIKDNELRGYLKKIRHQYGLSINQINAMMKSSKRKDVLKKMGHSIVKKIGVYCLTEQRDNILMWSHYADNHTGFCLEFKTDCEFFGRAQKIMYSENYPKFNFFTATQEKITKSMLLTKANDWNYEKEWRMIDPENGAGCKSYPINSITGVILGCRIEEKNKQLLLGWLSNIRENIKVYQSRQSKCSFNLKVIKL